MHLPGVSLSASFRSEGAANHQGVPCLPGECLGVSLGQMQCLVSSKGILGKAISDSCLDGKSGNRNPCKSPLTVVWMGYLVTALDRISGNRASGA